MYSTLLYLLTIILIKDSKKHLIKIHPRRDYNGLWMIKIYLCIVYLCSRILYDYHKEFKVDLLSLVTHWYGLNNIYFFSFLFKLMF